MRNENLEMSILWELRTVECGLRETALKAAVSLRMDRYDITTAEFDEAIRNLENAGCVTRWNDCLGRKFWGITNLGKQTTEGK